MHPEAHGPGGTSVPLGPFFLCQIMGKDFVTTQGRTHVFRKPKRLTATIPDRVYTAIEQLATKEGRSMSNLVAFALERFVEQRGQS